MSNWRSGCLALTLVAGALQHAAGLALRATPPVQQVEFVSKHLEPRYRILVLSAVGKPNVSFVQSQHLLDNVLNKECYATLHGYDFVFDSTDYVNGAKEMGGWNKAYSLQKHLPNYDWVLWMDHDQWFNAMTQPLTHFIAELALHGVDAHILVPTETAKEYNYFFANSAFLIRNSVVGRNFVESWIEAGKHPPPCHWRKQHLWQDQGFMWLALMRMVANATGRASPCLSTCMQPPPRKKRKQKHFKEVKFELCFNMDFNTRHYTKGHVGSILEGVHGPLVFSRFMRNDLGQRDVGLSVNLNHHPDIDMKLPRDLSDGQMTAFTWHLKPDREAWPMYRKHLDALQGWCESHLNCTRHWGGLLASPIQAHCERK